MTFDICVIEHQHRRVCTGIEYLENLFDSEDWHDIDEDHRFLLVAQHSAMKTLEVIFRRRLELLSEEQDEDDVGEEIASLVDLIKDKFEDRGISVRVVRA